MVVSEKSALAPGDYVELQFARSSREIHGLVHDLWDRNGSTYLQIYSYATREVSTYRLDRRGRLHTLPREAGHGTAAPGGGRPGGEVADGPTSDREPLAPTPRAPHRAPFAAIIVPLVGLALFAVVVLPLLQGGVAELRSSTTEYARFMEREMSLPQLASEVASRVRYRIDVEEYWSAPQDVWSSRLGDCEDHAMIVSAYLTRHGIEHTILGLSLEDQLQGHVVVVAHTEKGPALLDPTRATTPTGYRQFSPGTPLTEIVREYAVLPARVYRASPPAGRPDPIGTVG